MSPRQPTNRGAVGRLAPILLGAALTVLVQFASGGAALTQARALNPVQTENRRPGTRGWNAPAAAARSIEGYASEVSVGPGGTIQLHVSTTPTGRYRVEVFRLGWYGGAGSRLVACVPSCTSDKPGVSRQLPPFDPTTGLLRAGWPVTDRVRVGGNWASGYYVAKLLLTTGSGAGRAGNVPFVVTDSPARASNILVLAPVTTWQAYNAWGGRSFYFNFTGIGDNHVSFDRPYSDPYLPQTSELDLVRFLERTGYDVSYTTDLDVDRHPAELTRHRLVVTAGHGEYWTRGVRDALERARDLGTNLAFMGANTGYWQVRYEDARRTVVEYRRAARDPNPDPAVKTDRFRVLSPPRPECRLEGVQFQDAPGKYTQGFLLDLTVNAQLLEDPWFRNTGFAPGSTVVGLLGDEYDALTPGCTSPTTAVLFSYSGRAPAGHVVRSIAASGARVFASASFHFSWGLDAYRSPDSTSTGKPDTRLQQFMRNALDDLTRPAPPLWAKAARTPGGVRIWAGRYPDPQVVDFVVYRHSGPAPFQPGDNGTTVACVISRRSCLDLRGASGQAVSYAVVTRDRWRESAAIPVSLG